MDTAALSTFAGLAGAIIGGLTSFATTWLTTTSQQRTARLTAERGRREDLYGRYMDELATLYAAALRSQSLDNAKLVGAFALRGRIALASSQAVAHGAAEALAFIVDLSMASPLADKEVRAMMNDRSANVIDAFAEACRAELATLR